MKTSNHLLSSVLLCALLSACGNKKTLGPDAPPETSKPTTEESTPAPAPAPQTGDIGGGLDGGAPAVVTDGQGGNWVELPEETDLPTPIRGGGGVGGGNVSVEPPLTPGSGEILPPLLPGGDVVGGRPVENLDWVPDDIHGTPAESWLHYTVDPLFRRLKNQAPSPLALGRRQMITLALGYFDGYHDRGLFYENIEGERHVPVDPFLRAMVHEMLMRDCTGRLQLCGFEFVGGNEISGRYRKASVDGAILDIRLISSALSPRHRRNTSGENRGEQLRRSQAAERMFLNALGDSDFVVYVGHSRLGGGPDFYPPRLNSRGKVDYDFYKRERRGIRNLLDAVGSRGVKASALSVVSCDSHQLFAADLKRAASRSSSGLKIATIEGVLRAEDLLSAGLSQTELWLRQGTLFGLRSFLDVKPELARAHKVSP